MALENLMFIILGLAVGFGCGHFEKSLQALIYPKNSKDLILEIQKSQSEVKSEKAERDAFKKSILASAIRLHESKTKQNFSPEKLEKILKDLSAKHDKEIGDLAQSSFFVPDYNELNQLDITGLREVSDCVNSRAFKSFQQLMTASVSKASIERGRKLAEFNKKIEHDLNNLSVN